MRRPGASAWSACSSRTIQRWRGSTGIASRASAATTSGGTSKPSPSSCACDRRPWRDSRALPTRTGSARARSNPRAVSRSSVLPRSGSSTTAVTSAISKRSRGAASQARPDHEAAWGEPRPDHEAAWDGPRPDRADPSGPPAVSGASHPLRRALHTLERLYGPPAPPPVTDPLGLILWESVAYLVDDERRGAAFRALASRVGISAEAILEASPAV